MKFGIIVSCVFPHETLKECLRTLNETNDIHRATRICLAEDGYNQESLCKDLANSFKLEFFKCPTTKREPPNNWAIPFIWDDVDIVVLAHSDVVFTNPLWLTELEQAWEKAGDKIDCLNLSVDAVRYDTLQPVYSWRSMNEKEKFGYTLDVHAFSRGSGDSGKRIARMSPCYAVRSHFLQQNYPFDTDFDIELSFKLTKAKKWWFWLNNAPLQHRMGYSGGRDSDFIIKKSFDEFVTPILNNTRSFETKFGINMENYLYHDLGNKRFKLWNEIVEAANNNYLDMFDDTLDEIIDDLETKNHPDYIKMYGLEHTI